MIVRSVQPLPLLHRSSFLAGHLYVVHISIWSSKVADLQVKSSEHFDIHPKLCFVPIAEITSPYKCTDALTLFISKLLTIVSIESESKKNSAISANSIRTLSFKYSEVIIVVVTPVTSLLLLFVLVDVPAVGYSTE